MSQTQRKLNYRWAQKSRQDFKYKHIMPTETLEPLPERVDLTEQAFYPPVWDQGGLGACTAFAACAVKQFITARYVPTYPEPSQLGFYYSEREMMNTESEDSGSDGKTSGECMIQYGVGPSSLWPYLEKSFARIPSQQYFGEALKHKIAAYYFLHGQIQMQRCLANGYPFVFGMFVPKQMQDDNFNGYLWDLDPNKDIIWEGGNPAGHQVSCFGYEEVNGRLFFKCRNSWGKDWGVEGGHFYIESDMMTSTDWIDDCITYRLAREHGM